MNVSSGVSEDDKTYRCNKRAADERNHGPIEGKDPHTKTSVEAEKAVDDDVFRSDPADPVKKAEGCEQISGDPVPDKASDGGYSKETLASHMATVSDTVRLVQCIEERRVDKRTGPDHALGPDDELTKHTGQ